MQRFLAGPVLGVLTAIFLVLNISFWLALLLPIAVARLLVPIPAWQRACGRFMASLAEAWVRTSSIFFRWTRRTEWDLEVPKGLSHDG
ncbi:MAG TPA: hypothetical protein VLT87_16845, partial [Thermoanaerobaculia bacterium]|nr:hypothetical protein [Thermoanaerobaculia bacterium]